MSAEMFSALATALGTLAQVSAALAALIGFLGLWKLEWIRREKESIEFYIREQFPEGQQFFDMDIVIKKFREMYSTDTKSRYYEIRMARADRWKRLDSDEKWLKVSLIAFLLTALSSVVGAFAGMHYTPHLPNSAFIYRTIVVTGFLLAGSTAYMVFEAAGWFSRYRWLSGLAVLSLFTLIGMAIVYWIMPSFPPPAAPPVSPV